MTRIIAGLARGRRLEVPRAGTRPTSDRVREALFNTLASRVRLDGARVLDLYAGSGAVGLEALSRGATTAVLVESDARAADVIERNIATVGLAGAALVRSTVERFAGSASLSASFDLLFADPPYACDSESLAVVLARVVAEQLATDGLVVIERSTRDAGDIADDLGIPVLTQVQQKRYGDTVLWYGRRR